MLKVNLSVVDTIHPQISNKFVVGMKTKGLTATCTIQINVCAINWMTDQSNNNQIFNHEFTRVTETPA